MKAIVNKLNNEFEKVTSINFEISTEFENTINAVVTKIHNAKDSSYCTTAQFNFIEKLKNTYYASNNTVRKASKWAASAIISAAKANPNVDFNVIWG